MTTTWTYESNAAPLPPKARQLVRAWANRRPYPISWLIDGTRFVRVSLEAPTTREHNRAVGSLGRILTRAADRSSNLTPTP
jgi:hypothetical protein